MKNNITKQVQKLIKFCKSDNFRNVMSNFMDWYISMGFAAFLIWFLYAVFGW